MGRVNRGRSLVVGMLFVLCLVCAVGFPTCGISAVKALWSLYVVSLGVVYA